MHRLKSLKSDHFTNYLFHLMMAVYNNLSNDKKDDQQLKKLKAVEKINSSLKSQKANKKILNNIYPRKFKSKKKLDYHFKYKAPQFNNFTKNNFINKDFYDKSKVQDKDKMSENCSLNILNDSKKTKKNKENKEKELNKNEFEYKVKYDPNKISNNFIKFNAGKEYSKLSQKLEKNNENEKNKEINNKKKIKLSKKNIRNSIIEGYFGRKTKSNMPYLFDISATFYNNYSNKSEKGRHEVILNELNKLKAFIINDPKNKIQIFKNFLIRFNYNNIEDLTDEEIILICDFICIHDNDILFHLIKPYYKSKDIISDLINNLKFIVRDKKDIILDKSNERLDSQEMFNNNDDSLLKTKIKKNIKNKKPEIKNLIKSKKMSKTQNYFYNKMRRETYISPNFIPFKSHRIKDNNSKNNNMVNLDDTNSKLKFLSYQKQIQLPNKHFSLDDNLLINEISKEIRQLKENFDKSISGNQLNKFSLLKKKGFSHLPVSDNKINSELKINDNDKIFSKTCIQFIKEQQSKNENNKSNINIISLNKKNLEKLKDMISNSKTINKKIDKNFEKKLDEINERMYYKAINYEFGYKQIKDLYKITEVAALNIAKKRKLDKMKFNFLK